MGLINIQFVGDYDMLSRSIDSSKVQASAKV